MKQHDNFQSGWSQGPGVCGAGSFDQFINPDANEFIYFIAKAYTLIDTGGELLKVNEAGAGDLYWLRNHHAFFRNFVNYHGYELVNREIHPDCLDLAWSKLNICTEDMRRCDVVISRLVFIHLPNEMILQAIERFRSIGAKYLICSHFRDRDNDNRHDRPSYVGKNYNLEKAPFNLKVVEIGKRNAMFEL